MSLIHVATVQKADPLRLAAMAVSKQQTRPKEARSQSSPRVCRRRHCQPGPALRRPGSMRTTTGVLPVLLPARNSSAVHTFTDALEPSLAHANVRVVHSDTLLVWPRLSWATRLNGLDKSHTDSSQLDSKIVLFLLAFVMLICTLAVMWHCIVGLLDW